MTAPSHKRRNPSKGWATGPILIKNVRLSPICLLSTLFLTFTLIQFIMLTPAAAQCNSEKLTFLSSSLWSFPLETTAIDSFGIHLTRYGVQVSNLPRASQAEVLGSFEIPGKLVAMALSGETLYISSIDRGVIACDATSLPNLVELSQVSCGKAPQDIVARDDYAFLLDQDSLHIIDVSNAVAMECVATIPLSEGYSTEYASLRIQDSFLFVASGNVHVFSIQTPEFPTHLYTLPTPFTATSVIIRDSLAVIADRFPSDPPSTSSIIGYDVSDLDAPFQLWTVQLPGGIYSIDTFGAWLVTSHELEGMALWEYSYSAPPVQVYCTITSNYTRALCSIDTTLFVVTRATTSLDPQNPPSLLCDSNSKDIQTCSSGVAFTNPSGTGHILRLSLSGDSVCVLGSLEDNIRFLAVDIVGDRLYAVDDRQGLSIVNIAVPNSPRLLSRLTLHLPLINDIAATESALYICADGTGLITVDISDEESPIVADTLQLPGRVVALDANNNVGLSANLEGGLTILDLSNPLKPLPLSNIPGGTIGSVSIVENMAYAGDRFSRILVVDIAIPEEPKVVDSIDGEVILLESDESTLVRVLHGEITLFDITNPATPIERGSYTTEVVFGMALSHQILVLAQNFDGFEVIDVADPDQPLTVGRCMTVSRPSDIAISESYLFIADVFGMQSYQLDHETSIDGPNSDVDFFIPDNLLVRPNYPNPFNPSTTIEFALPQQSHVRLSIYNVLGQEIVTLVNGPLPAGTHTRQWLGRDAVGNSVSSGIYFYRLTTDDRSLSRKMLLVK